MDPDKYAKLKEEIKGKNFHCYSKKKCQMTGYPSTLVCVKYGEPSHLGCIDTKKLNI